LNKHGYVQSKFVPGLWKHKTGPIQFCLTVDNFGVKYVGQEHANHLLKVLQEHYKVTCDWSGTRYIGIHMHWDYDNHKLHLFMPGYVKKALTIFQHKASKEKTTTVPAHAHRVWCQETIRQNSIHSTYSQRQRQEIHPESLR
jgi:hypothetical protein